MALEHGHDFFAQATRRFRSDAATSRCLSDGRALGQHGVNLAVADRITETEEVHSELQLVPSLRKVVRMKTKIIPVYLGLLLVVMLAGVGWRVVAAPVKTNAAPTGPLNLFVATVVWEEANGQQHIASFVDALKTTDQMNLWVGSHLASQYPSCKVKSIKTDSVGEEIVTKLIQSRRGVRM